MRPARHTVQWPPQAVYESGGFNATPYPETGVVTWNINTTCNYRCSYCTQRFLDDRHRWLKNAPAFIASFAKLPGRWEVKISGGEPFVHPGLVDIVAGLRDADHLVSVVTNFSASTDKLAEFVEAAGPNLRVFAASLHLEYVSTSTALDEFTRKVFWLKGSLPAGGSVNVTCVASRENLTRLEALARHFEAAGINFKVQPEKQDRRVIEYTPEEEQIILKLGGHNRLGEIAYGFKGRPCWAGAMSFTLDDRGNAWRCYPARKNRIQYIGNFLSPDFTLAAGPSPCLYDYCNCTVPIERGMMPKGPAVETLDPLEDRFEIQDVS